MQIKSSTRRRHGLSRRAIASAGAAIFAVSGGAALLAPTASQASSHREAPLIAGDPRADNTDTYAFVSPDKSSTVTLIANWIPFEEPNGGPNYYPFAQNTHYMLHIDNNGDGKADINYIWTFTNHYRDATGEFLYNTGVVNKLTDKTLNFYQTYTLQEESGPGGPKTILKNAIVAPSDTGKASMPHYAALRAQATKTLPGGGKTYAGQADDPFFLDLRIFDLLYGANLSESGHDTLKGYNVNTLVLQVPKSELALKGNATRNPVIGVWSTTAERTVSISSTTGKAKYGPYVQVSRLGNPLVNEAVVPIAYKDAFNAIPPYADHTVAPVVAKVLHPIVPTLVQAIYGIPAPKGNRDDLAEIFLTGIAKNAPTLDGTKAPIQADLNSQILNADVKAAAFVPSEELRLNMAVPVTAKPNRLGVIGGDLQGFPNGRRLGDDVVDIALQALEGAAVTGIVKPLAAGDGVNHNEYAFGKTFPYINLPNTAAVNLAG
ncbi:DUF4331 domain-containing protein [Acidothermaceae bacterium B102]|nr:DUF4331 domain-containing protein [Acidothermaceae bacterium B102]